MAWKKWVVCRNCGKRLTEYKERDFEWIEGRSEPVKLVKHNFFRDYICTCGWFCTYSFHGLLAWGFPGHVPAPYLPQQ